MRVNLSFFKMMKSQYLVVQSFATTAFKRMIQSSACRRRIYAMNYTDIVLCALAALAVTSLAALWLAETDKLDKRKMRLESAAIDKLILIALITFAVTMIARHPEWLA